MDNLETFVLQSEQQPSTVALTCILHVSSTTVTAAPVVAALISLVVSLIYLISHSATEMDLSMPAVWGDRDIGFESRPGPGLPANNPNRR